MLALASPTERRLAYGTWRFREDELQTATSMLALARENGIDHVDTADVYGGKDGFGGAERLLGAIRSRTPSLLKGAVVATKAGIEPGSPYNSSAEHLSAACEASLKRLGVERLDLFYVHRPDVLTHPAQLAATLDKLVASGKVAAIGVSNFTTHQVDALARHLKTPITAHQFEFSAGHVQPLFDGTLDQAMMEGIAVTAWSPLAGGRLTESGGSRAGADTAIRRAGTRLAEIGRRLGETPAAVALAFLLRHPAGVTPIVGTKDRSRLVACLRSRSISLSPTEWYALLEASIGESLP